MRGGAAVSVLSYSRMFFPIYPDPPRGTHPAALLAILSPLLFAMLLLLLPPLSHLPSVTFSGKPLGESRIAEEAHTSAMNEPRRPGRTNLASCVVATVFLVLAVVVIVVVYLCVFKPKDPMIAVDAVKFPTFSVSNGTVDFTFSQYVAVKNPNRDAFTHYDSSVQLVYSGSEVGFMFIPAGKIEAGRTQYMLATFAVKSFPVTEDPMGGVTALNGGTGGVSMGMGPTMEIESKMKLVGRVRVLWFFTHRVDSRLSCSVAIEVSNGSVLGFHC